MLFINCCRVTSRDDWSEDRIKSVQQIAIFCGYIPTLIRPHNISFFLFFSSSQLYENSIRSEIFQVATLLSSFSVWYSWTVPIEYTNNVFFHSIQFQGICSNARLLIQRASMEKFQVFKGISHTHNTFWLLRPNIE